LPLASPGAACEPMPQLASLEKQLEIRHCERSAAICLSVRHCERSTAIRLSVRHCERSAAICLSVHHCDRSAGIRLSVCHCERSAATCLSVRHCERSAAICLWLVILSAAKDLILRKQADCHAPFSRLKTKVIPAAGARSDGQTAPLARQPAGERSETVCHFVIASAARQSACQFVITSEARQSACPFVIASKARQSAFCFYFFHRGVRGDAAIPKRALHPPVGSSS